MVCVGQGSRHGLTEPSTQDVSQAAFSCGSVIKEESTCKLKLLALAKFIFLTEFPEFISLPWRLTGCQLRPPVISKNLLAVLCHLVLLSVAIYFIKPASTGVC